MENQSSKMDSILWGLAVLLVVAGVGAQYFFASQSLLIRLIGLLLAFAGAVALIARTQSGRRAWAYWHEVMVELRKVVWPTRQETMHSTIAVLAMVFVMGLVLWSIDAVLVRVMAWIVRQGAA
jgi:preprotein translocase subunit SecE